VRDEEGCGAINPCCSGTGCCCGHSRGALESAFQTAKQKQVNAIMTTTNRYFFAERKRIVELAGKYRLPAIYLKAAKQIGLPIPPEELARANKVIK
jgi:hypothetical protein